MSRRKAEQGHPEDNSFLSLHERAEDKARLDETMVLQTLSLEDAQQLFHELRVYQIELEMQNEELRRTQLELAASRSRYFNLYDLAPVGYLTVSARGLILEVNLAAATMLGLARDDLLKKPISRFIYREDQDLYHLHRKQLFEVNQLQVWEMRLVRSDGSPFWSRLQAAPADNDEYWITMVDITQRKLAEEKLKASEESFKTVVMSANDGIILQECGGKIIVWNHTAERVFGVSASEVCGRTSTSHDWKMCREDGTPLPADEYPSMLTLASGKPCLNSVLKVERDGGDYSWINVNTSPIFRDGGVRPDSVVITFSDITERKRLDEQLLQAKESAEAANRAKSDFLATMSHEIRTPLGGLLGNVELLEGSQLTPQQQEYLKDCKSASHMLLRVINDVLDFSKIEAGKLELVNEIFSVSSMSRQLVRMFSANARQKGLDLSIALAADLPEYIYGDQQRLRQIISNLISNAIKFTHQGAVSLEITREQPKQTLTPDKDVLGIVVRDTGIGIPPDKLDHIFESFTQVESFGTRNAPGTGLGLPICRRLLALMGGSITVSSVLGEGSVFTVLLPVVQAQTELQEEAPPPGQATPRKILLADDDEMGRCVAQKLLERRGYEVTAVENGAELLEELQGSEFDIVLTDISMPDMEGTEVARIIRSGERVGIDPEIPIIAMTAHAFSEDRERFLSKGINGYISKPVNLEELFRQIEELCAKSPIGRGTVDA